MKNLNQLKPSLKADAITRFDSCFPETLNSMTHITKPSSPSAFRMLILGGGAIVTECHLPALKALGWLSSCAVVEPFAPNADRVRRRVREVHIFNEHYETFMARRDLEERFDGAIVALPNTLHAEASRRCLEAGLPVLCEKPLALTADECEAL